jgi:hypothetical protein
MLRLEAGVRNRQNLRPRLSDNPPVRGAILRPKRRGPFVLRKKVVFRPIALARVRSVTHFLSPLLPPATRFLLEEVCLPKRGGKVADAPVSMDELAAQAIRQGVGGLLHQWAGPSSVALPSTLGPKLKANAMRALALVREALQTTRLLGDNAIRTIVLKGPPLSLRYYGDFGMREAGDLDLLVQASDIGRADSVLRAAGYVRTTPANNLTPARQALYLQTQHEFGYRSPGSDLLVELHWRFADAPELAPYAFEDLWNRALEQAAGAGVVHTLGDRDTFVQLAIHGGLDGWSRLKWLADLPRVLARIPPEEIETMRTEARAMGHARMLDLALTLANRSAHPVWLRKVTPRIARRLADPAAPRTLDWTSYSATGATCDVSPTIAGCAAQSPIAA